MRSFRPGSESSGFGILSLLEKSQKIMFSPTFRRAVREPVMLFRVPAYSSDRRKKTSLVATATTAAEIR